MRTFVLGIVLGVATCTGNAQETRIQSEFDVVSIRKVPWDAPMLSREASFTPFKPGGQYIDARTNLEFMIIQAYEVESSIS
jgi:hypothetical protein